MLGYTCRRETFESCADAVATLGERVAEGPVLVGPVDMGLLAHQPGSDRASGADHFVVALEVTDREVVFHDPQGHPWAALPHDVFCAAWRAEQIGYATGSYAMRSAFEQREEVALEDALARSLKAATGWLAGRDLPGRREPSVGGQGSSGSPTSSTTGSTRTWRNCSPSSASVWALAGAPMRPLATRASGSCPWPSYCRSRHVSWAGCSTQRRHATVARVAAGLRRLGQLHDALAEEVRNAA